MPEYYVESVMVTKFVKKIKAPNLDAAKATVNRGITFHADDLADTEHTSTTIVDEHGNQLE